MKIEEIVNTVLGAAFFALFILLFIYVWFRSDIIEKLMVSDLIIMALCLVTSKALKN